MSTHFPKVIDYADIWISRAAAFVAPVWLWDEQCVLPFPMPNASKIKLKHNGIEIDYYKLYCGFDIETTNIDTDDKHLAFMYHWQLCIASDSSAMLFTGRTWQAYKHLISKITGHYNLDDLHRIILADANLGFEFQFFRKLFQWDKEDFFAREERHPMKCRSGGIEYHEVLTISGGSLAQLAKDYTKTQKLVGDLDYSIKRNFKTPLDKETELRYCENDVIILSEFMKYLFDTYIIPDKRIPLTKTGLLRSECRQCLNEMLGYDGTKQYRQLIMENFPDEKTYSRWFRYLFRGGYVHSNILLTGYTVTDVDSYDITSSYPAVMNYFPEYPLEKFKTVEYNESYLKTHACIMTVEFIDIRRIWAHSIESKSKCLELEGSKKTPLVIDNGRVAQAARMVVMLTNIDFIHIYKRFYKWKDIKILDFQISPKGYLPVFIRKTLNKYYKLKAEIKEAIKDGDTSRAAEYAIIKQKVNSFFGMLITRIELDKVSYGDEWEVLEKELDYQEELKSQFLLPQWGIFVTSISRWRLLSVLADVTETIGDGSEEEAGVIYCDTDSIKYKDPDGKVKAIIDKYNSDIDKLREKVKLTDPAFRDLGKYDYEGHYERFKTLGAKRYLTEKKGKLEATIAGLPKASLLRYTGDAFDKFNLDGMLIDAEMSLKNGISYNDSPTECEIEGEIMHEETSAGIFSMGFRMKLDGIYHSMVTAAFNERIRKYGD